MSANPLHIGIIGAVSGGGGVSQLTVNGAYPDYLPVDSGMAGELQMLSTIDSVRRPPAGSESTTRVMVAVSLAAASSTPAATA